MTDVVAPLVDGWREIQGDPRKMRHTKRVINSVSTYNREAGQMVKYLAEFVGLRCAPDMLAMRLFPNGKEISESLAAYEAVRYRLQEFALDDPSVAVVAVGDGMTPRTAATFALRSKWTCYSVDPLSRGGIKRWAAIERLHVFAKRIEDVRIEAERAIVVAVHSHAKLPRSLASIKARQIAVVAIPCCVPMALSMEPDIVYEDKGIISACRTVKVWRDVAQAGRCPVRSHKPDMRGSTPLPATNMAVATT